MPRRTCLVLLPLVVLPGLAWGQDADFTRADEVWADFQSGQSIGIQPMHAQLPCDYVERTVDGLSCVSTDGATGRHGLCFDVPRAFLSGNLAAIPSSSATWTPRRTAW